MILKVHARNFMVFEDYVLFNLEADTYIQDDFHASGLFSWKYGKAVRSAIVLGPNNAGKSCLVKAIYCIREFMFGRIPLDCLKPSAGSGSNVVSLGMQFVHNGTEYDYNIDYDITLLKNGRRRGFVHERLDRIDHDLKDPESFSCYPLFGRDTEFDEYHLNGDEYRGRVLLKKLPLDETAVHAEDSFGNPVLEKCRDLLYDFASGIDIVDMNGISLEKTVEALEYNMPAKGRILQFVRGAGLYIDDLEYRKEPETPEAPDDTKEQDETEDGRADDEDDEDTDWPEDSEEQMDETQLYGPEDWKGPDGDQVVFDSDCRRLYSCRSGRWYRILGRDSEAAVKLIALAGHIVDALDNGKTLVVDDLCRFIHPNIAAKIMELFGFRNCPPSQLILTASDDSLLDGKIRRLRMDQVFFIKRGRTSMNIRSMAGLVFRATSDRDCWDGDWRELYRHGYFGAVPDTNWDSFAEGIPERKKKKD